MANNEGNHGPKGNKVNPKYVDEILCFLIHQLAIISECEAHSMVYSMFVNTRFVCGISLTSGQLINELFPDCTRSCFSQVVLRHRGSDGIYVCLFVCGDSLTSGQLVKGSFQTA